MSVGVPTDYKLAVAESPVVYNVTLTLANTEYPQTLPRGCRKFAVRPRDLANTVKLAFASGQSGTVYASVGASGYWDDLVAVHQLVLYMQSTTAGTVVEITAWS